MVVRFNKRRIDFETEVDWNEAHKLLKVYFPFDIRTDHASFDIQNGVIKRATHANTPYDAAKLEVYGHKFVDVSEGNFGAAVLNDCKYGYSVRDGNVGLSLLKSSKSPNHLADMGRHKFIYSVMTHNCGFSQSTVFEEAHALNNPLIQMKGNFEGDLPAPLEFITLDSTNVVVSAFKVTEESEKDLILRLHEERGD